VELHIRSRTVENVKLFLRGSLAARAAKACGLARNISLCSEHSAAAAANAVTGNLTLLGQFYEQPVGQFQ
jgi:hypothetical protein